MSKDKLIELQKIIEERIGTLSEEIEIATYVKPNSMHINLFILNDDVRINTYQYGDIVFTHDAVIHSGSNEVTLQYPSGLIDTGEFRICVRAMDYDESACDTGYNSKAKQPERVFINLFVEENRNLPNVDVDDSQAQSQSQGNELSQSQSQSNKQTTTIINCPPDSRCVIEQ
jgi:hypothetical protein